MRVLVVNLITLAGLCGTFLNLYFIINKESLLIVLIILNFSIITDFIDGWMARKLDVETGFGAILDLFHDFFLYLIIPSIFITNYSKDIFVVIFLIFLIATGTFRLIRFFKNGITEIAGKKFWVGLPVIYNLILIPAVLLKINVGILLFLMLASTLLMPSKVLFIKLNLRYALYLLLSFNLLFLVGMWF